MTQPSTKQDDHLFICVYEHRAGVQVALQDKEGTGQRLSGPKFDGMSRLVQKRGLNRSDLESVIEMCQAALAKMDGTSEPEPDLPSWDEPCPALWRNGRHEAYTFSTGSVCRACGARQENTPAGK